MEGVNTKNFIKDEWSRIVQVKEYNREHEKVDREFRIHAPSTSMFIIIKVASRKYFHTIRKLSRRIRLPTPYIETYPAGLAKDVLDAIILQDQDIADVTIMMMQGLFKNIYASRTSTETEVLNQYYSVIKNMGPISTEEYKNIQRYSHQQIEREKKLSRVPNPPKKETSFSEWYDETQRAYRRLLPTLRREYSGKFVAIDREQIVDSGSSGVEVMQRCGSRRIELFFIHRGREIVDDKNFHVLSEWDGQVQKVADKVFFARMQNMTDYQPEETAEFLLDDVSANERELVLPGNGFSWIIGYRDDRDGRARESRIRFYPEKSASDRIRAEEEGKKLADALEW